MTTEFVELPTLQAAETAHRNHTRAGWRCFSIYQNARGNWCFMMHR